MTYTEKLNDFKNESIISAVSHDYHRDLIGAGITSVMQLSDAILQVRKACKWFPKPAEIIDAHNEVCRSSRNLTIPQSTTWHDPTPGEIERNKMLVSLAVQAVMGKISFADCERRQNEILGKNLKV